LEDFALLISAERILAGAVLPISSSEISANSGGMG